MGAAKVWNDNQYPHVEKFKGKVIEIPAGGCIEMDRDEALQFQGQFKAPIKGGNGKDDPRGFKMIRVEGGEDLKKFDQLVNPMTGKRFETKEELEADMKRFAHLRIKDENDKEELQKKIADQETKIDQMAAQIEELVKLVRKGQTDAEPTKAAAKR